MIKACAGFNMLVGFRATHSGCMSFCLPFIIEQSGVFNGR